MSDVNPAVRVADGLFQRHDYSIESDVIEGIAMGADAQEGSRTSAWRRSSRCNPDFNCVEVGRSEAGVIIRDSKGKVALHALDSAQWRGFLVHCHTLR